MKYLVITIILLAVIFGVGYLSSPRSDEFGQESLKQRMVFAAKKLHIITGVVAVAVLLVYLLRLLVHIIQSW